MLRVVKQNDLLAYTAQATKYKPRNLAIQLLNYLEHPASKICALYGLRRTGKTILLRQAAAKYYKSAVIIEAGAGADMKELYGCIDQLKTAGISYVFIDEITSIPNFITCASLLADYYLQFGMHIVLSGTDSLGFHLAEVSTLYDRVQLIHTTFIPFAEYSRLTSINDIDIFIQLGGTMDTSGIFSSAKKANEYSDTAIAQNIQNSLSHYQSGTRLWALRELYLNKELTNYINRIIEDLDHVFALDTILRAFRSYDLNNAIDNFSQDINRVKSPMLYLDYNTVIQQYKSKLQILEAPQLSTSVTTDALSQLFEYLTELDLLTQGVVYHCTQSGTVSKNKYNIVTQPGLRYSQAKALVESIQLYSSELPITADAITQFTDCILNEVKGRILEDWVILEVMHTLDLQRYQVGRFEFEYGEFDMVIYDSLKKTCQLFEIKRSDKFNAHSLKNLLDKRKCQAVENYFGSIAQKVLLYRGQNEIHKKINCINVTDFLKDISHFVEPDESITNFFG